MARMGVKWRGCGVAWYGLDYATAVKARRGEVMIGAIWPGRAGSGMDW